MAELRRRGNAGDGQASFSKSTWKEDVLREAVESHTAAAWWPPRWLFAETDASYLALFRIVWGLIMAYEMGTYCINGFQKVRASWYNTSLLFKFYGFEWVHAPKSMMLMKLVVIVLLLAAVCITIGLFYRAAALTFAVGCAYLFLLDQALYLNHIYLVVVMSFMLLVLPCHTVWSMDAWLHPEWFPSNTAPIWCLYLLRAELVIVYGFAGIVKLNVDWLRAEPLRQWLTQEQTYPGIKWLVARESTAYLMSYGGLLYDLFVGPMLLSRKFRWLAVTLTTCFHIANKLIFNIGIFPWVMIGSTMFFFEPEMPRRLLSAVPLIGVESPSPSLKRRSAPDMTLWRWIVTIILVLFLIQQVLTPVRNVMYEGDVAWNEEGHTYSWRMKLRSKLCDITVAALHDDHEGALYFDEINLRSHYSGRQIRKLVSRPDMIAQMGRHLQKEYQRRSIGNMTVEIYADVWCELNGRPYQRLVDPKFDIGHTELWQSPYPWVKQLEPLPEILYGDYPWNFEWNFNWLQHDPLYTAPFPDMLDRGARGQAMVDRAWDIWEAMLNSRASSFEMNRLF